MFTEIIYMFPFICFKYRSSRLINVEAGPKELYYYSEKSQLIPSKMRSLDLVARPPPCFSLTFATTRFRPWLILGTCLSFNM